MIYLGVVSFDGASDSFVRLLMGAIPLLCGRVQFVETPDFNPEAASQQYVPVDFDYGVNSQPTRKRGPG